MILIKQKLPRVFWYFPYSPFCHPNIPLRDTYVRRKIVVLRNHATWDIRASRELGLNPILLNSMVPFFFFFYHFVTIENLTPTSQKEDKPTFLKTKKNRANSVSDKWKV